MDWYPRLGSNQRLIGYQPITLPLSYAGMAGDDGFEPPNVGIKIRGLTAWRIP